MEIERKYLIESLPPGSLSFPFHQIEQGYLSTAPVVRVRREDDAYYLTYKSKGLMAREEYNLPLTKEAYGHLIQKADGNVLVKKRYRIPLEKAMGLGGADNGSHGAVNTSAYGAASDGSHGSASSLTVELDVFEGAFTGLILAEVEFPDEETAKGFTPPPWFGREVTFSGEYQNSVLSQMKPPFRGFGGGQIV